MMPTRHCLRAMRSWLGPLLFAGLYLAGLFLFAATLSRQSGAFGSDDLYCFSVCEDLLQGRDMQGWCFTAVPYIFPDLLLLLPCQALSCQLVVVILLYDFLFYSLLLAALAWVVRLLGFTWREGFLTACTGVLLLLIAHLDPAYRSMAGQMYQPGFHVGAILAGLLLMGFVLQALRSGIRTRTVLALLVLCPVAVFSDRLLIVEFLLPMLAGLCLLALLGAVSRDRLIALGLLIGTGMLLANGIPWCFQKMGMILMCSQMSLRRPHWEYLQPFFQQVYADMPNLILLPLHLLAGLAVVLSWRHVRGVGDFRTTDLGQQPAESGNLHGPAILFVASVIILSPLSNVAAVFLHSYDNPLLLFVPPASRYLFAFWLLPFLFLGLFVRLLPGGFGCHGGRCFRLAVVLLAAYRIIMFGAATDYLHFEPPYPPLAQTLDRLERERGPLRGLAGYWRARTMNFLTKERVWVRPAFANGVPWLHADNPNRFLADDPNDLTLPRYNFVIVSPHVEIGLTADGIRSEFGEPAEKIAVDDEEIWLYERLASPRFERFLEALLAQRLCRREPYVSPLFPSSLGVPKPNRTRWWSARNVRPEQGEELEIRFDRPVNGGLIDVAANFNDEYQLGFYQGEKLLGWLPVPSVPWTGAVFSYPPGGIQSRLVSIPDSLRKRSWDRVMVRSTGSSTERSLGHFLVFGEDVARRTGIPAHAARAR